MCSMDSDLQERLERQSDFPQRLREIVAARRKCVRLEASATRKDRQLGLLVRARMQHDAEEFLSQLDHATPEVRS